MSMNILPFDLQKIQIGVRDYNPNFNYDKMKIQSRSTLVFSKAFQDIFDKKINIFFIGYKIFILGIKAYAASCSVTALI